LEVEVLKMKAGWKVLPLLVTLLCSSTLAAEETSPVPGRTMPFAVPFASAEKPLSYGVPGLPGEAPGPSLLRRKNEYAPAGSTDKDAEVGNARESSEPPKKSQAEEFFFRPETAVGGAVGGQRGSFKKKLEEEEAQQESPFYLLLTADKNLTAFEKINLFLRLDLDKQKKYLEFLPVKDRQTFLKSIGEDRRWYQQDLKGEAVDRNLKQFGYDFFATTAGGFSPERLAPVGPDYVVGPGDTLVISLWGSVDGAYEVTVDRGGNIFLPRVGSIQVWGQTFAAARETIRRQIARYFTNFELNVSMGELRSIQVYLVGEVNTPGTYTLSSVSTVLNALAAAGGPAKTGSLRQIQLVRGGETVAGIDFYDFFLNGDRSRDARLQSGDTIHVPVVGPLVGVAGDVRRPAIYELKPGESLADLLRMAGGVSSTAFLKKVQIERVEAHRKKVTLDIDLTGLLSGEAKPTVVPQDRDLVLVSPISPARTSYVLLKGYVAHPGRYQYVEGMRVADLFLPYQNLLPDYFPDMVEVLRLQPPLYRPEKLTVDLARALEGDPQHNIPLQEYDEVQLFAREEMEEVPQVVVSGGVANPGVYRYYENLTVRDLITTAGNVKRGAYLAEAELSRHLPDGKGTRTERVLFNQQNALQGDPTENLTLMPEDHLFVRTVPDYTERLAVRVDGRVLFPGTYTIAKGETLSSVLERAGGFAEGAYLRGATFTRESVRELQQERLQRLVFEQEQQIARVTTDIALGALSPEEAQSAQTILTSRKALLEKLKQMPVAGRMVVRLNPLDEFKGTVFDIPLMEGDVINIPDNPKSVTILGQVYNPISLSYQPGKTVSYYLSKVGGPTENANADEMFIVRADGTVYSRAQSGMGVKWDGDSRRWVVGGFNNTELFPGDAILVPEKVKKFDALREIKDISTIIYQMALGAAAVA
jgi:polysaccharide export outer membrane protein